MVLLKGIGILSLGIWFAGTQDTFLRVDRAVPPIHPVNTLATGVVVVDLVFNQQTRGLQTRLLHSESPFVGAALDALNRWRFAAPPAPGLYRTSVSFLFRSPVFYSMKVDADLFIRGLVKIARHSRSTSSILGIRSHPWRPASLSWKRK